MQTPVGWTLLGTKHFFEDLMALQWSGSWVPATRTRPSATAPLMMIGMRCDDRVTTAFIVCT